MRLTTALPANGVHVQNVLTAADKNDCGYVPRIPHADDSSVFWLFLISRFKKLMGEDFSIIFPQDRRGVNCHGHAIGVNKWVCPSINPVGWWPSGVDRDYSVSGWGNMLSHYGWRSVDSSRVERGWEKLAVFTTNHVVSHSCKQLPNGRWESKLGESVILSNHTLEGISDGPYGVPAGFFRRKISSNLH